MGWDGIRSVQFGLVRVALQGPSISAWCGNQGPAQSKKADKKNLIVNNNSDKYRQRGKHSARGVPEMK